MGKLIKKHENLLVFIVAFGLLILQFLWFNHKLIKAKRYVEEQKVWHGEQIQEYWADISFQSKVEGQLLNSSLKLYSVRNDKYVSESEFVEKYICVFHLAEIGCNECYIHEFDIIREVLKIKSKLKKVAIVTHTRQEEFIIKLIKDYAPDFDVYQIQGNFFDEDIKTEHPFFFQINSEGVCYNAHKSSKVINKPTYLYLENLIIPID